METESSTITRNKIPENISHMHKAAREKIFNSTMDKLLDHMLITFWEIENHTHCGSVLVNVQLHRSILPVTAKVRDDIACIQLAINGKLNPLQIPMAQLLPGSRCIIKIKDFDRQIIVSRVVKETFDDDVYNYSLCVLQYAFVILNFKDAIKEGDIYRINVCLKLMIPLFYQHSELSKHMAECIDYVQKTEILLTQKMSIKVRAASFINKSGQLGRNKPADIEKENQVKVLKELIRGLGSSKTEESIVRISKAAPVIEAITLKFDEQAGVKQVRTFHNMRSLDKDLALLGRKLRELRLFSAQSNRQVHSFRNIASSPTHNLDVGRYHGENSISFATRPVA